MYFPDRGCVRPSRYLYGDATAHPMIGLIKVIGNVIILETK